MISIATLYDWLKNSAPVFQPLKTKTNRTLSGTLYDFSRALSWFQVIARNSDWIITLFTPVVIGQRNCFDIGFSTITSTPL